MVKLNLDTKRDSVEDLEEAIELLQEAVTRRRAEETIQPEEPAAEDAEEDSIEAGFLSISVKTETVEDDPQITEPVPDEPITETELTEMFEVHETKTEKKGKKKDEPADDDGDSFIEIIEFEDD